MVHLELFLLTLLESIFSIELSLTLFGSNKSYQKVFLISLLTGGLDYLLMNILVPAYNLPKGIHIIIGLVVLPISCKYFFRLNILGSIVVTILSYILSAVAEFMMFILLIVFAGATKIDSESVASIYGLLGVLTLLLPIVFLKVKKLKLIKLPIEENLN